jgi:hypothetical protein
MYEYLECPPRSQEILIYKHYKRLKTFISDKPKVPFAFVALIKRH